MMTKTAYYMQMAQEAAAQITGSKEQWTAFLTTSARLYKYPFAEQLMIYKQRPEATACAEYDLWNDRMNRYVKRGSKGIALLDMRGEQPKLRYVFDVADTGERKNSRPVQLWKMNAEHEQPIIRALDAAFDVPAGAGSLENHIMEAAERLARDYWEENRRQISDIVADSYLEGYDELNIGASFKRAAAVSIAYSVYTRTVGNADDYFEHEDFLDIFDFNTQAAANVLGTAVSEMSSQIFREIERTIRTYERDKQAERSQNYDGAELHEERRLPDSGHPVVGAGTEAPGQVRENAQSVPAGEQHAAVQSPDPDRETVPTPVGDSGDRDRTNGADDGGASESESGTGQEIEPDGLGTAHEHVESAGRGSYSDGTYQQLNFMSLFQSEAEQIQKIDAAAENAAREAESEKPSAFVISEDEIDRMLRTGSNFEGGKIRIYALYQQQGDAKERAAFLKAEYGIGGHSYTFMDGSRGFADYDGKGILLRNYGHDREARLTWSAVDKRLDRLVENGQYLTALEMEEYGFITDYLAEFIRELRKEQYGDALDKYFRLGKNLNQRDTIAVRKIVGGYVKLLYPDGEFTKEQIEEILVFALEMRRRVKEQLKKLGGMEFYDVNFSYIDLDTFEEKFVSVPEQGGGKLIPDGICNPGQVYTVSQGKSGMIGVFRLESQMLPGNGKFERTGLGSDRDCKESTNTAFNFLKANGNRISGSISTTMRDYIINYQDLQGIGMTGKLALPTLIALCSIALGRPTVSTLAVLGEISISGTILKVDELANSLQVCLDSGAKKVLLPITSAADLGTVPPELVGSFNLIFYSSAEDAVFKALGVE